MNSNTKWKPKSDGWVRTTKPCITYTSEFGRIEKPEGRRDWYALPITDQVNPEGPFATATAAASACVRAVKAAKKSAA